MAKVLLQYKLIFWDDCAMTHNNVLEALDRMMQDLRNNQIQFCGVIILLADVFRRILPAMIPRPTPADELNVCLQSSILWKYVKTLKSIL